VPDFQVRAVLGKKGTRSMDRVTGLAITTVGRLLDDAPRNREVATGESAALVLGTTIGSVQSQMDFVRDSFTGERPYLVDPARFPNAVMNCAAGQSAIWHRLKGPNTTIAGGRAAGLYALNYTRRLLRFGRAGTVLCGAVEEFSTERSWLGRHTREAEGATDPRPAGEAGESLGLSRWGLVRHVVLPGALPGAMTGLRYSLGIAWLALVFAEQINADAGIAPTRLTYRSGLTRHQALMVATRPSSSSNALACTSSFCGCDQSSQSCTVINSPRACRRPVLRAP
jgi:hypothetical protein